MGDCVFIGSAFVAKYPEGGGNFWVPLQYLLGLRALGVDAYWLELLWGGQYADGGRAFLATFRRHVERLGVADRVAVLFLPETTRDDPPGRIEHLGLDAATLRAKARDALLLNLAGSIVAPLRADFARAVLFDVDPGPFQLWAREYDLGVGSHDGYLTIGANLGAADSPIPPSSRGRRRRSATTCAARAASSAAPSPRT